MRGTLGEGWGDRRLFVSVDGLPERVEVERDTFSISGIPAGPVTLRIASEDRELARMNIRNLGAGASLSLERIRRDHGRDLAFPSAVRIDGAGHVTVNGLRMGDPGALPRRVDAEGVVLALDDDEEAILVRPRDDVLPDLAVVVTDSTEVLDASGDEASLRRLSPGDALRVDGRTESGYLYAERIRLADAPAAAASEPSRGTPRRNGAGDRGTAREAEAPRAERQRGSSREDRRVPAGHRPPPGECRDWDPNLPPGQQPPPRKC